MVLSQDKFPTGKSVSLVDLTINPQKYYGKKITVKGYISLSKESEGIFFNENDAHHNIFINGIGIYGLSIFDRKYVILSGTFNKNVIMNNKIISSKLYVGYISDITFVEDLDVWYSTEH